MPVRNLKVEYNAADQFCVLFHPYDKRLSEFVRYGVKPLSYRKFDEATKRWAVHFSKLAAVVRFAKGYYDSVDYRSLPEELQIRLVAELQGKAAQEPAQEPRGRATSSDPHSVLHLLPSAPLEVIKAAYRAMASITHPDHGGSSEEFRKIQEAYEALTVCKPAAHGSRSQH